VSLASNCIDLKIIMQIIISIKRFTNDLKGYISIPMILQDTSFRMTERFMIKAHLFINGCSIKNRCNEDYGFLRHPRRAGLETFYATLLISTRTLHGCSLLENAGAHSPEQPFSSINTLPKDVSNSS
jgi:hypothetical protein